MPRYLLLLHESMEDPGELDAAELQRIIDEYSGWAARLDEQGKLAGAEKLRDDGGRVLQPDAEVRQGPYHGAEDVISGYFIVEAEDYDRAVEMARTCPHFAYGGTIEVREIEPT